MFTSLLATGNHRLQFGHTNTLVTLTDFGLYTKARIYAHNPLQEKGINFSTKNIFRPPIGTK